MSSFWSIYITVIVLGSITGFLILLYQVDKKMPGPQEETEEIIDHDLDGITEYNNPLPRWWVYMFYGLSFFALAYLVVYPGLGSFQGVSGWTSAKQLENEVRKAEEQFGPIYASYAAKSVEALQSEPEALKIGQKLFQNNCSVCHGLDAKGSFGFPNLTDNDWLYGGEPQAIKTTILNGRQAVMPAWGNLIGENGISDVTEYVLQFQNNSKDKAAAKRGETIFTSMCAACHGPDAKGMALTGAPNLTDNIWLYGGDPLRIKHTIRNGRNGRMPAHDRLLGEDRVHILTAYVYSLSKNDNEEVAVK